jgi:H+/Na+-translocating ferredoxin:NAD+ oxidoreductase subunit B
MSETATARIEAIDALLPQTQCQRCGYAGCRPYAEAIAIADVPINQCPPGGAALIGRLAELLGREVLPLNPAHGREGAAMVVWIDPEVCIGCARCLPPCPVDAILGAQRQLHTVIESWCTGCELCLPACPVDCIYLRPASGPPPTAGQNRQRYLAQGLRRDQAAQLRSAELATLAGAPGPDLPEAP